MKMVRLETEAVKLTKKQDANVANVEQLQLEVQCYPGMKEETKAT